MTLSPIGRFLTLMFLSPLAPVAAAMIVKPETVITGKFSFIYTANSWVEMIGVSGAMIVAVAALFGLLRTGPILAAAVVIMAVCVPAAFLMLGFWSVMIPIGAYLGALPAFVVAMCDTSDRVAGVTPPPAAPGLE